MNELLTFPEFSIFFRTLGEKSSILSILLSGKRRRVAILVEVTPVPRGKPVNEIRNIEKFDETVVLLHLCLFQYYVSTTVKISTEIHTAATRCQIEHLYVPVCRMYFFMFRLFQVS
jgi:hypothetical protein